MDFLREHALATAIGAFTLGYAIGRYFAAAAFIGQL